MSRPLGDSFARRGRRTAIEIEDAPDEAAVTSSVSAEWGLRKEGYILHAIQGDAGAKSAWDAREPCHAGVNPVGVGPMTKVDTQLAGFGREVRRIREETGLTQDLLAERSGLSAIYIGTIENGKRDPSLSTVYSLARGLRILTSDLFGPLPGLSPGARETALLFDSAPKDLQKAVLALLHAITRKQRF